MKLASLLLTTVALTGNLLAISSDAQRGNYWDALMQDGSPVYDDPEVSARVAEVGRKVVSGSKNPHAFDFQFVVLNNSEPTAFAAPGGFVYVTTGLLRNLKSEDELAAVMAHEVGHINERHGMKTGMSPGARTFWSSVITIGAMAAGMYLGTVVAEVLAPHMGTYAYELQQAYSQIFELTNMATQVATSYAGQRMLMTLYQGYKEEFEFKADELAFVYTKNAGYAPEALVSVFERLGTNGGGTEATGISRLHSTKKALDKRTLQAKSRLAAGAAASDQRAPAAK